MTRPISHGLAALAIGIGAATAIATEGRAAPAHHDARVSLGPESGSIEIADVMTWTRSGEAVRFLLHGDLSPEWIGVGEQSVEWTTSERFNPRHFWERPDYAALAAYDHLVEITLAAPPDGWPDEFELSIRARGVIADSLHREGEEYGRSFDVTSGLIESRGVYLDAGSGWLPWVPEVHQTLSLHVDVPAGWSAVSTGYEADRSSHDDRVEIHLESPHAMPDLYLVAGPWVIESRRHRDVDLRTYLYAADPALSDRYISAAANYLDRYEAMIGPYPFRQFALVENFWETGYGMPGFTLLGSTVIRLPFIVSTSFGHEILHCWWGNGVFVDRSEGNWCEGLTSYLADYAYKEDESPAAARSYRRDRLAGYKSYVIGDRDIPLAAFANRHSGATEAIGYGKAMMIVHMIRKELGDEAFFAALRRFYSDHAFASASWTDLLRSFFHGTDLDPDAFRAEWIERAGAPRIGVDTVVVTHSEGQTHVHGRLTQSEPTFRLNVPVELRDAKGKVVLRETIPLLDAGASFQLTTDAAVAEIVVDPDFDLFRRLEDGEIPPVLAQTLGADTTYVVVGAGGSPEHREAYRTLAMSWGEEEGVIVFDESETDPGWDELGRGAVWILGESPLLADVDAATPTEDDTFQTTRDAARAKADAELAWVLTKHHPRDGTLTCSVIGAKTPGAIAAVGRKVPHYGKYSYLFFQGATNIGKGTWTELASPLVVKLPRARRS